MENQIFELAKDTLTQNALLSLEEREKAFLKVVSNHTFKETENLNNQIVDFLTACGRVLADHLAENNELAFELKQRFVELYVLKSVQGGNVLSSTLEQIKSEIS